MNNKSITLIFLFFAILYCGRSGQVYELKSSSYEQEDYYDYSSGASGISDGESPKIARFKEKEKRVFNTEEYDSVEENGILSVANKPLSTFSIDVDTASYSNMRRYLNYGNRPPLGAIRTEELVNYFNYDYAPPGGSEAFLVHTEMAKTPWNPEHLLLQIGIKGRGIDKERAPLNLVFLLDVSGSMDSPNKLPLLKKAFSLLSEGLTQNDRVSIVVYAGASGMVLKPTPGSEKDKILDALEKLSAGGSTNGGAGIELAYSLAEKNFIKNGVNRVILATDGDFNVGPSSQSDLVNLIQKKAKSGVFLTVLGFGMGNYKDSSMEKLADKGNGNYAYIDTLNEAKKVLVREMNGTLFTIAKDVKIQVEFNPNLIKAYRLIGYENRKLADKDFADDKKDAGDIGAEHSVTALYELIPVNSNTKIPDKIPLKYQKKANPGNNQSEAVTVKLRYKKPDAKKSELLIYPVKYEERSLENSSQNMRFATAVASFSLLLRESKYIGDMNFDKVYNLAKAAKGQDRYGYREEFLGLVKKAKEIYK